MFRIILPVVLGIVLAVTGCSTDQDDELILLGEWIEEAPVGNRTELYFHSASRVSRTTEGVTDEYFYRIVDNTIFLRPQDSPGEPVEVQLFFRQISENSFQIENLYPSVPGEEITYMIFRRKGTSEEVDEGEVNEEEEGA